MKVAICMRGAISKLSGQFSYPGQIDKQSQYVNYRAVYNSIVKHIIEANPTCTFDFFLQSWNTELQDELTQLYRPKAVLFEDNNDYNQELILKLKSLNKDIRMYGSLSQVLSICKSLNLMHEHDIQYDRVIVYRYDVLLWKDMILSKYEPNSIYANGHPDSGGDFHFVMNYEDSKAFAKFYDRIEEVGLPEVHRQYNTFVNYFMNKQLLMDDILPGVYQEVLRKLYLYSVCKGYITKEKCLSYGLTEEELYSYIVE
jgi:hypothetical protein